MLCGPSSPAPIVLGGVLCLTSKMKRGKLIHSVTCVPRELFLPRCFPGLDSVLTPRPSPICWHILSTTSVYRWNNHCSYFSRVSDKVSILHLWLHLIMLSYNFCVKSWLRCKHMWNEHVKSFIQPINWEETSKMLKLVPIRTGIINIYIPCQTRSTGIPMNRNRLHYCK